MLVLSRRRHQSVVIGDGVVVTVLEVKGDQVRLGITAPREVQVYREELLTAVAAANTAAVLPSGDLPVPAPVSTVSVASETPRRPVPVPRDPRAQVA